MENNNTEESFNALKGLFANSESHYEFLEFDDNQKNTFLNDANKLLEVLTNQEK